MQELVRYESEVEGEGKCLNLNIAYRANLSHNDNPETP